MKKRDARSCVSTNIIHNYEKTIIICLFGWVGKIVDVLDGECVLANH